MGTGQDDGMAKGLTPLQIDAIGEVMNISMGSAATAVSQMLDKQVEITTPKVEIKKVGDISYTEYEPALLVKIVYTSGITGSNVMLFHQRDMQVILNTLMGIPDPPSDEFEFDELSISAACEVMNQMMGSSATALAEFMGKKIDISPPEASVLVDTETFLKLMEMPQDNEVVSIVFQLSIKGMLESEFVCVMDIGLAQDILSQFINSEGEVNLAPVAPSKKRHPQAASPDAVAQAAKEAVQSASGDAGAENAAMPAAGQVEQAQPVETPPPGAVPQQAAPAQQSAAAAPPAPSAPEQPMILRAEPNEAAHQPSPASSSIIEEVDQLDVRPVEFPEFPYSGYVEGVPVMGNNMDLIMNVPLEVSIEIGTTKRKIRDIMNFTSGTVVELDKQAGAPVDIVVNGQLIAHGDVVVIDDNFGVRITEIVGTKELINSLGGQTE